MNYWDANSVSKEDLNVDYQNKTICMLMEIKNKQTNKWSVFFVEL